MAVLSLVWNIYCYNQDIRDTKKLTDIEKSLTARLEVRKTLAQFVAGYVVIVGLVVTWEQLNENRKQFVITSQIATEELLLSKQSRLSDRYFKSSEMLGDSNEAIRISGVLALKHIAIEDAKNFKHVVIDLLSTLIKSKRNKAIILDGVPISSDIINCILVIGELNNGENNSIPDLTRINIRNADISSNNLCFLNFSNSEMREVNFNHCDLNSVNFTETKLDEARFINAKLMDAIFKDSSLKGAKFTIANLTNTDFSGANLNNATFLNSIFKRTVIRGANLKNALYLTQPQIEEAIGDNTTILPDSLRRPTKWR